MTTTARWDPASLLDPEAARHAGRDVLSLALIDARNVTLAWMDLFEAPGLLFGSHDVHSSGEQSRPLIPLHDIGQIAWAQEFWVARHVQRGRGEAGDVRSPRLPSVHHRADAWFSPWEQEPWRVGPAPDLPDAAFVRSYLEQTLELTLELLEAVPTEQASDDAACHIFRWAVLNEDRLCERLAGAAHWMGIDAGEALAHVGPAPARGQREPLWMPARRFVVGSPAGGLVPPNERWAFEEAIPAFEIDAQPVTWSAMSEFAEDGGYDDARWWAPDGWAWVQVQARRAPRGVVQWHGGVLRERAGQIQRAPSLQAAAHVTWYEADAWCRWAGRRLPTEVEWEQAACTAASRGFVWGDVWEWALGGARMWPTADHQAVAGFSHKPVDARYKVLRGASSWTAPRCRWPRSRRFVRPERDDLFSGFRSCAL